MEAGNVRWDAVVGDRGFWAEPVAASPRVGGNTEIHVRLFGSLAVDAETRHTVLRLGRGATVGDVLTALGRELGPERLAGMVAASGEKLSTCRVFVDGVAADDASFPIAGSDGTARVEVILLVAAEGG